MCGGSKFFKTVLPVAALAAGAYFSGGGSLAGLFGSGAASAGSSLGAAGTGAALSSSAAPSVLSGLTAGTQAGATLGGSALGTALSSSAAPSMAAALTNGFGAGLNTVSNLSSALNFAKDNSFMVGQGLNLAGAGAQMYAQNQMYDELNNARRLNELRNNDLIEKGVAITDANLSNFSVPNQRNLTDNAYERRMSAAQGAYASPNSIYLPISDSAPKEVKDASARRIGDILDAGREQISAGAKLGAFGDADFFNALDLNEGSRKIGTLQNFANGNNNVLNSQIQNAFLRPRTAKTVGDALQGAGAIANVYSITRPAPKPKTEFGSLFS